MEDLRPTCQKLVTYCSVKHMRETDKSLIDQVDGCIDHCRIPGAMLIGSSQAENDLCPAPMLFPFACNNQQYAKMKNSCFTQDIFQA
jgi:hypothetical protein